MSRNHKQTAECTSTFTGILWVYELTVTGPFGTASELFTTFDAAKVRGTTQVEAFNKGVPPGYATATFVITKRRLER